EERVVIGIFWEESERDWGTSPDGMSLHKTMYDYEQYVNDYWARQPERVPDCYSRPVIAGNIFKANVTKELYKAIEKSENSIRLYNGTTNKLLDKKEIMIK
ncbi:MAG: hypothetical protein KKC26_04600, partial [Nanoarchaeota archaeon]|nr:hypothetical protein [Nanoarchaeota archaeon]MBU1850319.1 hypothetical protein [Nanoarchaeota archaeon]